MSLRGTGDLTPAVGNAQMCPFLPMPIVGKGHIAKQITTCRPQPLLLTPLLILPACATTGSAGNDALSSSPCAAFEPIRWSAKNTDETIRQAKEHNAAWAVVCSRKKYEFRPVSGGLLHHVAH